MGSGQRVRVFLAVTRAVDDGLKWQRGILEAAPGRLRVIVPKGWCGVLWLLIPLALPAVTVGAMLWISVLVHHDPAIVVPMAMAGFGSIAIVSLAWLFLTPRILVRYPGDAFDIRVQDVKPGPRWHDLRVAAKGQELTVRVLGSRRALRAALGLSGQGAVGWE